MKRTSLLPVMIVIGLLLAAETARADGWLSPFGTSQSSPPKKNAPQQPSTLQKFNGGVKNFFSKTGEALSLKKPAAKKPTGPNTWSGLGKTTTTSTAKKQPEKKSMFSGLFKREEPKPPQSMNEFMQLKRIDP